MKRDIYQAIADPTRRKILKLLASKPMTPNELSEYFDISRQAVSKHIKYLTECDVLEKKLSGREIYYKLNPEKMAVLAEWLEPFKKLWEERFEKLDALLKIQINKNKE